MNQREAENNSSDEKLELIKWFSDLGKNSENLAGEKGANLSEIYNLKLPINPGFIITTQAYEYFIENSPGLKEKINGLLNKINYEDRVLLNDIAEVIMRSIIEAPLPRLMEEEILDAYDSLGASDLSEIYGSALDILQNAQEPIFVAVRSSVPTGNNHKEGLATQQDSFLNIKGEGELILHIKKCFASLFTPNEIYSRYTKGLKDSPVTVAIIIQKMVDSNKSGIIFTKNPNNQDNHIIIQAIWGLGEGAASKIITPDEYTLNKDLEIMDIKVAEKEIAITRDSSGSKITVPLREEKSKQQVLTKKEIIKLARLALQIEEHYKRPQCIEYAIEGEDIYLVQTRPIEIEEGIRPENNEEQIQEEEIIQEENKKTSQKELKPLTTKTNTKIKLAIEIDSFSEKYTQTGIKSAGPIKIEKIISSKGKHPNYYLEKGKIKEYEQTIFNRINNIAEHFDEIWIRTSDIKTDEFQNLEGAPKEKEKNPILGLHGIRFTLKNPEILEAELNAIKRIKEKGKKVGILLPNITLIEEIKKVKEILKKIDFKEAQIGIVIETPAAVQMISDLCYEGINFISFDIKNLTQHILAVDSENKEVREIYNEMHPAILYQLSYVIRVCKRKGVESNIYGQVENKKEIIKFLVENNIDSITINAEEIEEIAEYVKGIEENMVRGTDKEPRKYNPKENKGEEAPLIKGIENLNRAKKP